MVDDPVDSVAPWTIKAVSTATRNKAIVAARKEGLTVGQWLERRINQWEADGGPVTVATLPVRAVASGQPASPSLDEIGQAVRLAAEIAGLRGLTLKPNSKLLVAAQRLLTQRIAGQP